MSDDLAASHAAVMPDASVLIERITVPVIVADRSGLVTLANEAAARLLGTEPSALIGASLLSFVPDRFKAAHIAGFGRFSAVGQLAGSQPMRVAALRADGSEIDVELAFGVIGRPDEVRFAVVATLRDVTDRVKLEAQAVLAHSLPATVDAAREAVIAIAPDFRVLAVNHRFFELWQLPPDALRVGDRSSAALTPLLDQLVDPAAFETDTSWGREHPDAIQTLDLPLRDGRIVCGRVAPVEEPDGTHLGRVWYLWDDTERRTNEQHRDTLLAELRVAQRAQRFLLDVSAALAHASGFTQTLQALARAAVPSLGDVCLIDVLDERGAVTRVAAVHADPGRQYLVDELRKQYPPDPAGVHPSVDAMQHRHSRWSPQMSDEFLRATTRDERHFAIVKELAFTSYISVPLIADGPVLGSVALISAGSGRQFDRDDVSLAEELAERVALVVAKERRYDQEKRISHALQASLLPADAPAIAGLVIATRYLPGTRDAEVGGDFWDCTELPSGEIVFAVGDVEGHDIIAAATMAQLRSACRALRTGNGSPAELIGLLQQTWHQLGLERIATAVFGRLSRESGELLLATAGHPPPLIVEPDRVWLPALDPASPLGAPASPPTLWTGMLPTSAAIVFYTDGLVEDRHRDIDEGTELLVRAASTAPSRNPQALADHILGAMSGEDRADDVALLIAQRDG